MKIVYRIMYAIFMVVLFWFILQYVSGRVNNKYFNSNVEPDLALENPTYSYFFKTVPTYHNRETLYSLNTDKINVRMYDVVLAQDTATIESYVYILIHHKEGFNSKDQFILNIGEDYISVMFAQGYINKVLLALDDESGEVYMDRALVESYLDLEWKLLDLNENVILTFTPNFNEEISTKDEVQNFVNQNQKLPQNELNHKNIFKYELPNYEPYYKDYFIGIAVYGVILIGSIYIFFVRRKRKNKIKKVLSQG